MTKKIDEENSNAHFDAKALFLRLIYWAKVPHFLITLGRAFLQAKLH